MSTINKSPRYEVYLQRNTDQPLMINIRPSPITDPKLDAGMIAMVATLLRDIDKIPDLMHISLHCREITYVVEVQCVMLREMSEKFIEKLCPILQNLVVDRELVEEEKIKLQQLLNTIDF
jgi:hypothetical protein